LIRNERLFEPECRALFVFFTVALLVATHWPGLYIPGPFSRTDLIVHAGVFCVWTWLFYGSGFILGGRVCPCGTRRLIWTAVIGMCFAVFDETTQPLFRRVFDLWDLIADIVGVLLAVGLIALSRRVAGGAALSLGE
tara:strand:+ start:1124 stop:1534 length:411 start_codon:yes stop_codon:yes gene_type:complete